MNRNSGFSLVELMIVIVIIGVLAAVAVPIYNNNVMKAKMSEADAALGSIRTQLRVYYGENGTYPTEASAVDVVGASWNDINTNELDGKYFSDSSYTYLSADGAAYTITCKAGAILEADRTLNQAGTLAGGLD
ncbi:MAG: prepilin-type N-terminal cleavage/methylation domain-containing protein [Candidatus Marinimicrobia bacterium]|jgi:type IV pilus assembly protein PilA|nr:prepilin-type N-terminal cleavage/methylation domain-containing protein [Candidatus Neomarinimicrobiota bacterium]MBT3632095.1 prepilin-type N-terminal cleavage/methylation domain-containing protein [Candidatus Neomarinimicrobiota bacterium]MBT3825279.1 prepilin-type N-terminal cleavage/methylation domain-containing protein [Candidatus Neomarinimicrobiota bacterium]MBT4130712.1 prepilin-type N-terminal cleavage/methylation domain-containing protein [Candidatus Neomarinimicrobiota bacterium]M